MKVTDTNILNLFKHAKETVSYGPGKYIFKEGQDGDCMYVLLSGKVELVVNEKTIEQIGPGAIFGEMGLIDECPRSASALVLEQCKLAVIDGDRFLEMVEETPSLSIYLLKTISLRLRKMNAAMNA